MLNVLKQFSKAQIVISGLMNLSLFLFVFFTFPYLTSASSTHLYAISAVAFFVIPNVLLFLFSRKKLYFLGSLYILWAVISLLYIFIDFLFRFNANYIFFFVMLLSFIFCIYFFKLEDKGRKICVFFAPFVFSLVGLVTDYSNSIYLFPWMLFVLWAFSSFFKSTIQLIYRKNWKLLFFVWFMAVMGGSLHALLTCFL